MGVVGLEPTADGLKDRHSTVELNTLGSVLALNYFNLYLWRRPYGLPSGLRPKVKPGQPKVKTKRQNQFVTNYTTTLTSST